MWAAWYSLPNFPTPHAIADYLVVTASISFTVLLIPKSEFIMLNSMEAKSTFMSVLQKNRNLKQLRLFRVDEPISKKKQQCLAWKNPLQIWIIPVDDWAIHKCFIWKQDYSIYIFLSQIGKQIKCIKMFWKLDPWSYFHYWLRSQWKDSLIFFFPPLPLNKINTVLKLKLNDIFQKTNIPSRFVSLVFRKGT